MSDLHDAPGRSNARKAAARQLQQQYPGMKYTQAYAASAPDAEAWRQFAQSGRAVHLAACALHVLEATGQLVAAADGCHEGSERDRLWVGAVFAHWLCDQLRAVETHARTVEGTAPFVERRVIDSAPPPLPEPLRAGVGEEIATLLRCAHDLMTAAVQAPPAAPTEVQDAAVQVAAVSQWASTPPECGRGSIASSGGTD